jgi:hypothetical protein
MRTRTCLGGDSGVLYVDAPSFVEAGEVVRVSVGLSQCDDDRSVKALLWHGDMPVSLSPTCSVVAAQTDCHLDIETCGAGEGAHALELRVNAGTACVLPIRVTGDFFSNTGTAGEYF